MKKLVSLILCFIMVIFSIPTFALAEEIPTSGKCGENISWEFDEKTATLNITGTGEMYDLTDIFHASYSQLYFNNGEVSVKNVIISDGITRIGNFAFFDMASIESITLGKDVKSIGEYAFRNLILLETMVFPDSLETIEMCAFNYCFNLKSIIFGKGLKEIKYGAFNECYALKEVIVPNNVTTIGKYALGYNIYWSEYDEEKATPSKDFVLIAEYGSAAQKYAYKNGIKYDDINGCEKHIFGEKQIAIKKICTKQRGMYYKQCKNCNSRRFSFKSKSHTFKAGSTKTVRKATFFKNGIKTKYCTYCKKNIKFKTTKFINMPSVERKVYKNKVKFSLEKAQKGVTHYEIRLVKANGDYKNSQKIIAKVNDDIVFKNLKSNTDYEYERRYVIKNGKKTVKGNWYVSSFTTKK